MLSVKELDPNNSLAGKLTPSLLKIIPHSTSQVIREIQEFTNDAVQYPYLSQVNDLYIVLDSVNFSGKGRFRNILVKIEFKDSDSLSAAPLKVIIYRISFGGAENFFSKKVFYGKKNSEVLSPVAHSSVNHHSKTPFFYDEFKLKLPIYLTNQHHLLFTFYHISCKTSKAPLTKSGQSDIQTLIGYAVLPIYQQKR